MDFLDSKRNLHFCGSVKLKMESNDRILVAAGLTAAVVVGAFVLWGPGGAPKTRKRRGQIAGLQNLGRTCFLNTLLQALAACPSFVSWLRKYAKSGSNNSMITTLSTVLEVVNGTHESARGAAQICPLGVLNCLKALGWVVPADQHDAHELLHVLLSCIEEEIQTIVKRPGCLSDALGLWVRPRAISAITSPASPPMRPGPPSLPSAPPGLLKIARLRAASSPATPDTLLHNYTITSTSLTDAIERAATDEPEFIDDVHDSPNKAPSASALQKGVSRSFCHLNVIGRGLGGGRAGSLPPCIPPAPPFNGTMATRLQCTVCSNKTPVRYDKFDSVSLPLVNTPLIGSVGLSLATLLRGFTAPELLRGVACTQCDAGRPDGLPSEILNAHIKAVSFGKLPTCLCLHLSRTQWTSAGLSKRNDHVAFPETLSLAPFSSSQPPKVDLPSLTSILSQSVPSTVSSIDVSDSAFTNGTTDNRSSYRLQAVVVHVGGPRSGHFVTYRRGNGFESKRWFYTSDTVVHEVQFDEVLRCNAYMLFYEKVIPSTQFQTKFSIG